MYDSRVVIYERKMFIRLATDWLGLKTSIAYICGEKLFLDRAMLIPRVQGMAHEQRDDRENVIW